MHNWAVQQSVGPLSPRSQLQVLLTRSSDRMKPILQVLSSSSGCLRDSVRFLWARHFFFKTTKFLVPFQHIHSCQQHHIIVYTFPITPTYFLIILKNFLSNEASFFTLQILPSTTLWGLLEILYANFYCFLKVFWPKAMNYKWYLKKTTKINWLLTHSSKYCV